MRLPFWGTLLTIIGVCVLCSLGAWQLQRLEWKEGVLMALEREYALDATEIPITLADFKSEQRFKRGYLKGKYLHDKEIQVQGRIYDGKPGYHVITPFQLEDHFDHIILVNRGWVPMERVVSADVRVMRPVGYITLVGMLRDIPEPNPFVLDNVPEEDKWFSINLAQIVQEKGVQSLEPKLFYVEQEDVEFLLDHEVRYPILTDARVNLKNNHAQYAFFWFAMACAMVGVYVARFALPKRDHETTKEELCG